VQKLAIIHFSPLEIYPPIMNWLRFLENQAVVPLRVVVYTRAAGPEMPEFMLASGNIIIKRLGGGGKKSAIPRYFDYLRFYSFTLLSLLRRVPGTILYYESLSAFPAIWYRRLGHWKTRIFAHYHEYISPKEYAAGMVINHEAHRLEKYVYPQFKWISHTNSDRMELFRKDNKNIRDEQVHILPNYPPLSWAKPGFRKKDQAVARFVYVGALSLGNMYTVEFAQWIIAQNGKAEWGIYTNNITEEAKAYIESLTTSHIYFWGSVDYFHLPHQLEDYDAGVILYKGTTANYVYNAPNKLFEYIACGLDVWFPAIMKSCYPYITDNTYPQVRAIDFDSMHEVNPGEVFHKDGMQYKPSSYFCERVCPELFNCIIIKPV
jgi:hypothetical protein